MKGEAEIRVAGASYRLVADEDGPDLTEVAELVEKHIDAIRAAVPDISTERAAILAALNVGADLLREREAVTEAVEAVRARFREVEQRVARSEGAPPA